MVLSCSSCHRSLHFVVTYINLVDLGSFLSPCHCIASIESYYLAIPTFLRIWTALHIFNATLFDIWIVIPIVSNHPSRPCYRHLVAGNGAFWVSSWAAISFWEMFTLYCSVHRVFILVSCALCCPLAPSNYRPNYRVILHNLAKSGLRSSLHSFVLVIWCMRPYEPSYLAICLGSRLLRPYLTYPSLSSISCRYVISCTVKCT